MAWFRLVPILPLFILGFANSAEAQSDPFRWLDRKLQRLDDAIQGRNQSAPNSQSPQEQERPPQDDTRETIAAAQQRLNNLGYDAGPVDGAYGPKTRAAIRSFRQDQGLPPGDQATPELIVALDQALATNPPARTADSKPTDRAGPTVNEPIPNTAKRPQQQNDLVAPPLAAAARSDGPDPQVPAKTPSNSTDASDSVRQFDLRTIRGRAILPGYQLDDLLTGEQRTALKKFFELAALKMAPELAMALPPSEKNAPANSRDSGRNSNDLSARCIAANFLDQSTLNKLTNPPPNTSRRNSSGRIESREWKGSGHNEFEVEKATREFNDIHLKTVAEKAPALPARFVLINRVELSSYDFANQRYYLSHLPQESIGLPTLGCLHHREATSAPMNAILSWELRMSREDAQALVETTLNTKSANRLSGPPRSAYAAVYLSLGTEGNRFTANVEGYELYAEPDLITLIAKMDTSFAAKSILEGGSYPPTTAEPAPLDGFSASMLLLRSDQNALSDRAWKALTLSRFESDQSYYQNRRVSRQARAGPDYRIEIEFESGYTPFFPRTEIPERNQDAAAVKARIAEQNLARFKQHVLDQSRKLGDQFTIAGRLVRERNSNETRFYVGERIDLKNYKVFRSAIEAAGLQPDQLRHLETFQYVRSARDQKYATVLAGQSKERRLIAAFADNFDLDAPVALSGSVELAQYTPATLAVRVRSTSIKPFNDSDEAFILHLEPVALSFQSASGTTQRMVLSPASQEQNGPSQKEPLKNTSAQASRAPAESLAPSPSVRPTPQQPWGLDVIGIRLGMSFAQAEELIRKHMEVGRTLVTKSEWRTPSNGEIPPYSSGRLYVSKDGSDIIALFDHPPAASQRIVGLWRQLAIPKNAVSSDTIVQRLKDKYGSDAIPHGSTPDYYLWLNDKEKPRSPSGPWSCISNLDEREDVGNWRNPDGSIADWVPDGAEQRGQLPGLQCKGCDKSRAADARQCLGGVAVGLDRRSKASDRLVFRLVDESAFADLFGRNQGMAPAGSGKAPGGQEIKLKF